MHSRICCRLQIFISAAVQLEGRPPGKCQQSSGWDSRGRGKEGECFWWGTSCQPTQPREWALADGHGMGKTARSGALFGIITDSLKNKCCRFRFKGLGTWTRFYFHNSNHRCQWRITTKLEKSNSYFSHCPLPFPPVNSRGLYVSVSIVLIFLFSSFIFKGVIVSANSFDLLFRESTCSKSQHWILNDDCLQWISS